MKGKALVGMSGGVDSLVTALTLQKQGYEVRGITFHFYRKKMGDESGYINEIAKKLNIEHGFVDATELFHRRVIRYLIEEHRVGRTPCACAMCNKHVKFHLLLAYADAYNCDYISTGHYVRIQEHEGHYYIHKGKDSIKDQSYFLWALEEDVLKRLLTPLGDYLKQKVKDLATEHHFEEPASKKESMGLCFLQKNVYQSFLKKQLGNEYIQEGPVMNKHGKIVGKHQGAALYTIGQERGFNTLDKKNHKAVLEINADANTLTAGNKNDLYRHAFTIDRYQFINMQDIHRDNIEVLVRGIGHNPAGFAKLQRLDNQCIRVTLDTPAWAVAPGQPAVFYIGERLIGGGWIIK
jgi:tRNA-specific 2-thiouridylase